MIKISPDKERAKSIFEMVQSREQFLKDLENIKEKTNTYPTIIAENYYEIIKELCVAIALIEGYKAVGENTHKDAINFVKKYGFDEYEIEIMQDLRIRRNKSSYEGKMIEEVYLTNIKADLSKVIFKLKNILNDLLKK